MTQHLLQGQLTRQTIKIKLSFLSLLQIFHKDNVGSTVTPSGSSPLFKSPLLFLLQKSGRKDSN